MLAELRIIRSLLSLFSRYRFAVGVSVVLGILSSFAEGVGVALFIPFIEAVTDPSGVSDSTSFLVRFLNDLFAGVPPDRRLFVICLGILGAVLAKVLLYYVHGLLLLYLDWKMGHDIRSRLASQILTLNFRDIERRDSAELLNTLSTESWNATDALSVVQDVMVTLCTLVVYVALLLLISPWLTVLALASMFAISAAVRFLTRHVKAMGASVMAENTVLGTRMLEIVEGNKIIRTFGRENYERTRFDAVSERLGRLCYKLGCVRGLVDPVYEVGGATVLVLILFISTQDPANLGSALVFIFALYRTQPKIAALDGASVSLRTSSASIDAVRSLLDQVDDPALVSKGTEPFQGANHEICFDRVGFKYHPDDTFAMEDVTIRIPARKTTALVGPSGAGKSTVIKLLLRLYEVQQGEIRVDDRPLRTFDLASWREKIAVVSQDGFVFNASVRDNIAYGRLEATDQEIVEAAKRACAHDFICSLPRGYLTKIGDRGVRLSAGQVQRLTLARAMVRDPDILILDEATNSVDSISERIIQDALEAFAKTRTVIIIAHRFSTIEQADHIVVLENGRVREQGSIEALLERDGLFARLHALQRLGSRAPRGVAEEADPSRSRAPLAEPAAGHSSPDDGPMVSVIIPCFQQGRYLARAIESVLAQTYRHHEVIVVNDGSTDDTAAVAARYPGVRYLERPHQGLAAARNAGIDAARGQLLVFLDADDRLLPNALESGIDCLRARPDCGFVFGAHVSVSADGVLESAPHVPSIGHDIYLDLLADNRIAMHGSIMFRREAVIAAGKYDPTLRAAEDYDLCLKVARLFPAACHANVVAEYWKHDANMSTDAGLMLRESVAVLRRQAAVLRTDEERAAFREGLRHWQQHYGELQWAQVRAGVKDGKLAAALGDAWLLFRVAPAVFAREAARQSRRTALALARRLRSSGNGRRSARGPLASGNEDPGDTLRSAVGPGALIADRSTRDARPPVILLYHRIADVDSDPWALAVSPKNFREHLRILRQERKCIPLGDLVRELAAGRLPANTACVAFDDGYSDNLVNGRPILQELAMPAAFFLTSGYLSGDREFWWDALERPFFQPRRIPDRLELQIDRSMLRFDFGADAEYSAQAFAAHRQWRAWDPPLTRRHLAYHQVWQALHQLPSTTRDEVLRSVWQWAAPVESTTNGSSRPLSAVEVRDLASDALTEIGGHTVTHPSLPLLDRNGQEHEILENKRCLERLIGRPLRLFSYPHGEASEETVVLVKRAGYEAAFTTQGCPIEESPDIFRLPRIAVEDWTGEEFARRLTYDFVES